MLLDPVQLLTRRVELVEGLSNTGQLRHVVQLHRMVNVVQTPLCVRSVSQPQVVRKVQIRMKTMALSLDDPLQLLLALGRCRALGSTKLAYSIGVELNSGLLSPPHQRTKTAILPVRFICCYCTVRTKGALRPSLSFPSVSRSSSSGTFSMSGAPSFQSWLWCSEKESHALDSTIGVR